MKKYQMPTGLSEPAYPLVVTKKGLPTDFIFGLPFLVAGILGWVSGNPHFIVMGGLVVGVGVMIISLPLIARPNKKEQENTIQFEKASNELTAFLKSEHNISINTILAGALLLGKEVNLPNGNNIANKTIKWDTDRGCFVVNTKTTTITNEYLTDSASLEEAPVAKEPAKVLPDKLFAPASR